MRRLQQNHGSPCTPPPGPSRGVPPLMSPAYSRTTFPATACTAVVSEERSVTMDEWWLAKVEGHEQKIAVAGFFERNLETREFTSGPISKRYEPCTVETEDGILVFLYGFFNPERTLQNGYSIEVCERFSVGFPHWWEEWNVRYPKMTSSRTGSQLSSSTTSKSLEIKNVLSASMEQCTIGCKKTHVASLHDKAVPGGATDEQYSVKDNQSPLTPGMSMSVSVLTPEHLKLKRTRSGRVIVPKLDSGHQNIAYNPDGSVSAIVGLDLTPPPKGSESKKYA